MNNSNYEKTRMKLRNETQEVCNRVDEQSDRKLEKLGGREKGRKTRRDEAIGLDENSPPAIWWQKVVRVGGGTS